MHSSESMLALARKHVASGERLLSEQRDRLSRMEAGSVEAGAAAKLLSTMSATQDVFVADLARLEAKYGSSDL